MSNFCAICGHPMDEHCKHDWIIKGHFKPEHPEHCPIDHIQLWVCINCGQEILRVFR